MVITRSGQGTATVTVNLPVESAVATALEPESAADDFDSMEISISSLGMKPLP
jgi:hypothetical protein